MAIYSERDLRAVAFVVRARREELRLRQADLRPLGGPCTGTVSNVEHANGLGVTLSTLQKTEKALGLPFGLLTRVVEGRVDHDELLRVSPATFRASSKRTGRPCEPVRTALSALGRAVVELSSLPELTEAERTARRHALDALDLLGQSYGHDVSQQPSVM